MVKGFTVALPGLKPKERTSRSRLIPSFHNYGGCSGPIRLSESYSLTLGIGQTRKRIHIVITSSVSTGMHKGYVKRRGIPHKRYYKGSVWKQPFECDTHKPQY